MNQKHKTQPKEKNGNKNPTPTNNIVFSLTKEEHQNYQKYKGITKSDYKKSQWDYF